MPIRARVPSLLVLVLAGLACGEGKPRSAPSDDAVVAAVPSDGGAVSVDSPAPEDPQRPRSEPPPRPPPPPGIKALRRDAVAIALSGDGRFLAGGDLAGQALLWDLSRGRFLWADPTPEGNRLGRVVFAADAPIYLAGSFHEPDRPWRWWAADVLERRGELGDAGWTGLDAALNGTGTVALTLSAAPDGARQKLELWDLEHARVVVSRPLEHALRGSVALDEGASRLAVSDDLGGVKVFSAAPEAAEPLFEGHADGGQAEASRLARLALSADGEVLVGASGARILVWSIAGKAATTSLAVGGENAPPVRGLHRVRTDGASRIIAVTRPEAGGLALWELDGRPAGTLDSACRCESHALSADGRVAACGCSEASELRWGLVSRPGQ